MIPNTTPTASSSASASASTSVVGVHRGTTTRRALRIVGAVATTGTLMSFGLVAASAHVGVTPASTSAGGYTQLIFTVPSESPTALTEKVEIKLPTDTPFTSLRAMPVEGWTAEIVRGALPEPVEIDGATITEGPLSVIYTANDEEHSLSADEFQAFSLSVGRLPEAGTTVNLPTIQTYTDGEVSSWDQPTEEGGEEPESPAPFFVTTAGGTGHGGMDMDETATEAGTEAEATSEATGEATGEAAAADTTSEEPVATEQASATSPVSPVSWVALIASLLALGAGVMALLRVNRNRAS